MPKYAKPLIWGTLILAIFAAFYLIRSPSVRLDRTVMQQVPIVRECYPLAKPYLETLRTGKVGTMDEGCVIRYDEYTEQILTGTAYVGAVDSLESNVFGLPPEEIEAIDFLMNSSELPFNCNYMRYPEEMATWDAGVPGGGGVFYEDSSAMVGIFRFEDNRIPAELTHQNPYYEELGDNYWLLAFYQRRD